MKVSFVYQGNEITKVNEPEAVFIHTATPNIIEWIGQSLDGSLIVALSEMPKEIGVDDCGATTSIWVGRCLAFKFRKIWESKVEVK